MTGTTLAKIKFFAENWEAQTFMMNERGKLVLINEVQNLKG